jgi:hypothetical protein
MRRLQHIYKNRITGVASLLLGAILGTAGLLALPGVASGLGNTLYVGHGSIGTNKSCASPGYNSVQTAVNAATTGQTVYLCGGQFAQQVFVSTSITLTGDPGSGLTAVGTAFTSSSSNYPPQFTSDGLFLPQALLVTTGNNVQVNGLTVSGPIASPNGCSEDEYGILALAGSINLNSDRVLDIASSDSSLYGCQYGVGIQIGREYWEKPDFSTYLVENFSAKANINNVTVSGYQKNGITVDGVGSSANITNSTINGGGSGTPFGTIIAQNGIQISRGAKSDIENNNISNNAYSGDGWASSGGILLFGGYGDPLVTNVNVNDNKLVNNDVGIYMVNYDSGGDGPATTPTKDKATDNWISNKAVTNVSGICYGDISCGGSLIGYQAGINDVGDQDTICYNSISGIGYAYQGKYNYSVNPPVFTQTGPNSAVIRAIDAGDTFPTTDPQICHNVGDDENHNIGGNGNHHQHWDVGWEWYRH